MYDYERNGLSLKKKKDNVCDIYGAMITSEYVFYGIQPLSLNFKLELTPVYSCTCPTVLSFRRGSHVMR